MPATLEFYMVHQVIRGKLRDDSGHRTIDVLNAATSQVVTLTDALSASLHVQAPPTRIQQVRVRRTQVMLIVPQSVEPLPPRQFRVGFVEKKPMAVGVGIGPFIVTGTIHISPTEPQPLAALEHDPSGRFFIPITKATMTSQYNPNWSLSADLIFMNRAAITCTYPLATA
ncbi:MAG: hypothetical protein IT306_04965 [Chloroflexi bacterium]|nr:hypothetical protein [Chloroflexota bacterium]